MRLYLIYCDLPEYPGKYVTRGCTLTLDHLERDAKPAAVADTLEEARSKIPRHLNYRVPRHQHDEPQLLETWL
jgi:hypothetical protein